MHVGNQMVSGSILQTNMAATEMAATDERTVIVLLTATSRSIQRMSLFILKTAKLKSHWTCR